MSIYFSNIAERFKKQQQKGINKYGHLLEENPRGSLEALEYLAEELTDGLMYIEESIEKVARMKAEIAALHEENGLQRQSIQDLSCQVVAYREALLECVKWFVTNEVQGSFTVAWMHGFKVTEEFSKNAQNIWDAAKRLAGMEGVSQT